MCYVVRQTISFLLRISTSVNFGSSRKEIKKGRKVSKGAAGKKTAFHAPSSNFFSVQSTVVQLG